MAVWVTRAGRYGENEPFTLKNNCVITGWEEFGDEIYIGDRPTL